MELCNWNDALLMKWDGKRLLNAFIAVYRQFPSCKCLNLKQAVKWPFPKWRKQIGTILAKTAGEKQEKAGTFPSKTETWQNSLTESWLHCISYCTYHDALHIFKAQHPIVILLMAAQRGVCVQSSRVYGASPWWMNASSNSSKAITPDILRNSLKNINKLLFLPIWKK